MIDDGGQVEIFRGELLVAPQHDCSGISEKCVAEDPLPLLQSMLKLRGVSGLFYEGFSTGQYGRGRYEGITLQFVDITTRASMYTIFNAGLTRTRNSKSGKKGDRLPGKQFRVGPRSNFVSFWRGAGLEEPKRLAAFHDYMGNLKGIVFTTQALGEGRLQNHEIEPLTLGYKPICQGLTNNSQPTYEQHPDGSHTDYPDNDSSEMHEYLDYQRFLATGGVSYGLSKQGSAVIRNIIPVHDQSTEEWLTAYD